MSGLSELGINPTVLHGTGERFRLHLGTHGFYVLDHADGDPRPVAGPLHSKSRARERCEQLNVGSNGGRCVSGTSTAVLDERRAKTRLRASQKAARTRERHRDSATWSAIVASKRATGCRCELRPGMSWRQLVKLGEGCRGGHGMVGGYVCSTLDLYRSKVSR